MNELISQSAGGFIIRDHNGTKEVLLIENKHGNWGFPKGHVDEGESAEDTAIREVKEETGFIAEIQNYLGNIVRGTKHEDGKVLDQRIIKMFRMTIIQEDPAVIPEENFSWFPYDKAVTLMRYGEDAAFLKQHHDLF